MLQPDEPVSEPSSAKLAVIFVPSRVLDTASPLRNAVTSQSPSSDASSYRSSSLWSASARTSSEPSRCHAATRPSAARYARSTVSAGGGQAIRVDATVPISIASPSTVYDAVNWLQPVEPATALSVNVALGANPPAPMSTPALRTHGTPTNDSAFAPSPSSPPQPAASPSASRSATEAAAACMSGKTYRPHSDQITGTRSTATTPNSASSGRPSFQCSRRGRSAPGRRALSHRSLRAPRSPRRARR